ncbi:DNA-binding MurR/RpiR family transcriptional regulator [Arthrobacter pascens]|uniref:MurR/RpiR family transcriptional regulator n=1 Tax=Arthrobacter pascens TaxID=1677 RepID=UPI0027933B97|nr:MurR/RpiR family transcriptional regulator [Arthrobacter pascens]MDQ0679843.1 DNA-binding MurR/RpiR family transcriptional regulator [Arthrobacter pascens]
MRIDERIGQHYPELSPQEQKAADTLLDRMGDLATFNAAELASLSGVSKATMSRLFRRLGFADFNEVKEHTRNIRSSGIPLGSHSADAGLVGHMERELENVRRLFELLDDSRLAAATRKMADADTVLLIGYRNSFPVALHLRQQLLQCRKQVNLAPLSGQSLGEELASLGKADAVVIFGFRRRPAEFHRVLKAAASTGAVTILIGDSSARRFAADVTIWIECPVDNAQALDSYASAMSLVSVLANGVLTSLGRAGRERVRKVTGLFDSLDEIESH